MALNWNIEKCKNFKGLTTEENWGLTDTLIWATMFTGISTITEANYKEFYARLNLVQRLNGPYTNKGGKPYYITVDDVQRRIGLTTNAGSMTRAQFIKMKVGNYFKEVTA
jgi:hypothetical protein